MSPRTRRVAMALLAGLGLSMSALSDAEQVCFDPAVALDVEGEFAVALADFDGDGRADLLTDHAFEGMALLPGDGGAGFGPARTLDAGVLRTLRGLPVGDLDGDGDVDLLAPSLLGTVRPFLNDGRGRFAPGPEIRGRAVGSAYAFADLDRDGDVDLVASGSPGSSGARPSTFFNDGAAGFHLEQAITALPRAGDLLVGDLDGDGAPDLFQFGFGSSGGAAVHVFRNDGTGHFAEDDVFRIDGGGSVGIAVDVDDDGDDDLVTNAGLLVHDGAGGFEPGPSVGWSPAHAQFPRTFVAADIDRDGRRDLLRLTPAGPGGALVATVEIARRRIDGGFEPVQRIPTDTIAGRSLLVGDVDGDGRPEVIADTAVLRQAGEPPPIVTSVVPDTLRSPALTEIELRGSGLRSGLTAQGAWADMESVEVLDEGRARLRLVPRAGWSGGDRIIVLTNPDGRRTLARIRVHSLDLRVTSARLVDVPDPLRDLVDVRGRVAVNALASRPLVPPASAANPPRRPLTEVRLRVGPPTRPLEVVIAPDSEGWSTPRPHRPGRLVWTTPAGSFPRMRFVLDTERRRFRFQASHLDFPAALDATSAFSLVLGEESGGVTPTWRVRRRAERVRLRR